jgi:hypothetical protein
LPHCHVQAQDQLLEIRKSTNHHRAFHIGSLVLEESSVAFALFQAVTMIKDAAIRCWTLLSTEDITKIRDYLVTYSINRYTTMEVYVLNQILQAVSVFWKCAWHDERQYQKGPLGSCSAAFFGQLEQILSPQQAQSVGWEQYQCSSYGARYLQSLIVEFSFSNSSTIGSPLAFHSFAHAAFEANGIQKAAVMAFSLLQRQEAAIKQHTSGAGLDPEWEKSLSKCLLLCLEVMSWDFGGSKFKAGAIGAREIESQAASAQELLCPGPGWRDTLLHPELFGCVLSIYQLKHSMRETTQHTCRQLLVQFASIHGKIFEDDNHKARYLQVMLTAISHLFSDCVQALNQSTQHGATDGSSILGAEVLAMCQLLQILVKNFQIKVVVLLDDPQAFFVQFSSLSSAILRTFYEKAKKNLSDVLAAANMAQYEHYDVDDVLDTWLMEAFDLLLDAWVVLAEDPLLFDAKRAVLDNAIQSPAKQVKILTAS